jgi:anaphase-promoting complex subunit 1
MSVALFDHRWDGTKVRSLIGICLPATQMAYIYSLSPNEEGILGVTPLAKIQATSIAPVRATRRNVWDLLVLRPDRSSRILSHGTKALSLQFKKPSDERINVTDDMMEVDGESSSSEPRPVSVKAGYFSTVQFSFEDGSICSATINLFPQDDLTMKAFHSLALTLPPDISFQLYVRFLYHWSQKNLCTSNGAEFDSLALAIDQEFDVEKPNKNPVMDPDPSPWAKLAKSTTHKRFKDDPVLKRLKKPEDSPPTPFQYYKRHSYLGPVLYALNSLAEELRLTPHRHVLLFQFLPLVVRVARVIRPEWADYWHRLCPTVLDEWPAPHKIGACTIFVP